MKTFLILLFLSIGVKTFSQQINQQAVQNSLSSDGIFISKYQKMKKNSKAMIIFSSVCFAGGSAVCAGSYYGIKNSNNSFAYFVPAAIGAFIGFSGISLLIPSICKYTYAVKKLNKLAANSTVAVSLNSLRITCKF